LLKLIPFGNVRKKYLDFVKESLEIIFGETVHMDPPGPLPKKGFNSKRGQFDSIVFLENLLIGIEADGISLGLTAEDIYTERMNFIFGHAQVGGHAAIVSLKRLDPEFYGQKEDVDLMKERILKEVLHEVGHVLGRKHCNVEGCVMTFSSTVFDVDEKSQEFCEKCIKALEDQPSDE